jgi:hypothetical protein
MSNSATSTVKTLVWDTNYNNKIGCAGIVHIDLAPSRIPSKLDNDKYIFDISTNDGSHPTVRYKFEGLNICSLKEVPGILCIASHGMDDIQFCEYMFSKYKNITWNTKIAVYLYRRI